MPFYTFSRLYFDQIRSNKQIWCKKLPTDIYYCDKLYQLFDGNISLITLEGNGLDGFLLKYSSDPSDCLFSSEPWSTKVDLGIKIFNRISKLTIKSDTLVASQKRTLRKILNFTKMGLFTLLIDEWYNKIPLHTELFIGLRNQLLLIIFCISGKLIQQEVVRCY